MYNESRTPQSQRGATHRSSQQPPNFSPQQWQTLGELSQVFDPHGNVSDQLTLEQIRKRSRAIREYSVSPSWNPSLTERIRRSYLRRRIRSFDKPTNVQIALRRIVGIGLLITIGAFGISEAQQAIMNYQLAGSTLTDIEHVLGTINIFDIPQTTQNILGDMHVVQSATVDMVRHGAQATAAGLGELLVASRKPWKKPARRGMIF